MSVLRVPEVRRILGVLAGAVLLFACALVTLVNRFRLSIAQ